MTWAVLAASGAALALLLAWPNAGSLLDRQRPGGLPDGSGPGGARGALAGQGDTGSGLPGSPGAQEQRPALVRRLRWPCAVLAGVGCVTVLGGPLGWVLALPVAAGAWSLASRVRDPGLLRAEQEATRQLPHLVLLVGAGLRSGLDPARALTVAADALPGPAAARIRPIGARLAVGVPEAVVWADLASDPVLGALGRTVARATETGAPVADAVDRLADDLADEARGEVEDRARAVGVRAALPLGLCLLPAFLLLGIAPVVAGLLQTIT